jgi:hypothetical protein
MGVWGINSQSTAFFWMDGVFESRIYLGLIEPSRGILHHITSVGFVLGSIIRASLNL